MPREKITGVSRSQGTPYTQSPSVRSQVIARPVGDASVGLDNIAAGLNSFLGGVSNAFESLSQAEHMERMNEIEQENQRERFAAMRIGLENGELTPDQMNDTDFTKPWNQAKAMRAVAEDSNDFAANVLPKLAISDDPFAKLNEYIGGKLKGVENQEYASEYMLGMLRSSNDAMGKWRADATSKKQEELQQDWKAGIGLDLRLGNITNVDQLMARVAAGAALWPQDMRKGELWAVQSVLNLSRQQDADGTELTRVTQMLQQPVRPTPDNPDGLSFATRFPDGFNALVVDAEKNLDAGFQKKVTDASYAIDQSLAADDVAGAMVQLQHYRGLFGDVPEFRQRTLAITKAIASTAEERYAMENLLTPGTPKDTEMLTKYGHDAVKVAMKEGGPLRVSSLLQEWNYVPSDFAKELNISLTKTNDPQTVAAYYETVAGPLFDLSPALITGALDDDAEFVVQYMHTEKTLRNADPLASATEALTAMDNMRKSGKKRVT